MRVGEEEEAWGRGAGARHGDRVRIRGGEVQGCTGGTGFESWVQGKGGEREVRGCVGVGTGFES